MKKHRYNLFINKNFDTYQFNDTPQYGHFSVSDSNLMKHTLFLSTNPTTVNMNTIVECAIYPALIDNVSFDVGDLLQTTDNNAIFIITNHINNNNFGIKLVQSSNNVSYTINTNTFPVIIYNQSLESFWFKLNKNRTLVNKQQELYTTVLYKTSHLINFFNDKVSFNTDYTSDFTCNFNFTEFEKNIKISNIIDKFYLNFQVYDYNDFKYIYQRDIIESVSEDNYTLSNGRLLMGVIKTSNTKIIPHHTFKLQAEQQYTFTDTILNKYTSYEKNYDGSKILLAFQLSLKNKSIAYDLHNNVESDIIFQII